MFLQITKNIKIQLKSLTLKNILPLKDQLLKDQLLKDQLLKDQLLTSLYL